MFNLALPTSFGLSITVLPSVLLHLPSMNCKGPDGQRHFDKSPAIQLHAPSEMLHLGRLANGVNTRLGMLDISRASIGIAMTLIGGHFAVGMFDFGDPEVQAVAKAALAADEMRFVLSKENDAVLIAPKLTDFCRHVLATSASARMATFSAFTDAIEHSAYAFAKSETFDDLGLDSCQLKSVTLSVCMPGSPTLQATSIDSGRERPSDLH